MKKTKTREINFNDISYLTQYFILFWYEVFGISAFYTDNTSHWDSPCFRRPGATCGCGLQAKRFRAEALESDAQSSATHSSFMSLGLSCAFHVKVVPILVPAMTGQLTLAALCVLMTQLLAGHYCYSRLTKEILRLVYTTSLRLHSLMWQSRCEPSQSLTSRLPIPPARGGVPSFAAVTSSQSVGRKGGGKDRSLWCPSIPASLASLLLGVAFLQPPGPEPSRPWPPRCDHGLCGISGIPAESPWQRRRWDLPGFQGHAQALSWWDRLCGGPMSHRTPSPSFSFRGSSEVPVSLILGASPERVLWRAWHHGPWGRALAPGGGLIEGVFLRAGPCLSGTFGCVPWGSWCISEAQPAALAGSRVAGRPLAHSLLGFCDKHLSLQPYHSPTPR